MFKAIARGFMKFTGLIPYLFYLHPKYYYSSIKAKKESKNLKNGVILMSNHVKIKDYYVYIMKYFFHAIHTMVADVVYKNKGMTTLNNIMGNIKISRSNSSNMSAITKCLEYLKKGKTLLIFPEGKLEDKPGVLTEFKNSIIYLAWKSGKPIIPIYTDGKYGWFKRPKFIFGEKIYISDYIKKDQDYELTQEDYKFIAKKLKFRVASLKHQLNCIIKYKVKTTFCKSLWFNDFMRITSIPIGYLVFLTKKYYLGDKKKIKIALKEKCILAPNHIWFCDVIFLYLHFLSRRVRVLAQEGAWSTKFLGWVLDHSGVVKYHRDSMNQFDINCFMEVQGILEGNGVMAIFPQGHLSKVDEFKKPLKGGTAMFSLMSNAPVIPIIFLNCYRYFRYNRVVIGDPIYPKDYFDDLTTITPEMIDKFNNIIFDKMNILYNFGEKKGLIKYDKSRNL